MTPSGRHFPLLLACLVLGNVVLFGGAFAWWWVQSQPEAPPAESAPVTDEVPDFMQGELPNRLPRSARLQSTPSDTGFVVPLPPDVPTTGRALVPPPSLSDAPSSITPPLQESSDLAQPNGWPSADSTASPATATSQPHTASAGTSSDPAQLQNPMAAFPSLNPTSAARSAEPPPAVRPPAEAPPAVSGWPSLDSPNSLESNAPPPPAAPSAPTPPLVVPSSAPTSSESYLGDTPLPESLEVAPQENASTDATEESAESATPAEESAQATPTPRPKPSPTARRSPTPRRPSPTPSPTPRATPSPTPGESRSGFPLRSVPSRRR